MNLFQTLCLVSLSLYLACSQELNQRPILGILSTPSDMKSHDKEKWSYIAASYVKFIESAGAQVVPIPFDTPKDQMRALLNKLNGVLLTGGGAAFLDNQGKKTPMAESVEFIVNYVLDENSKGNYYPLWGTCQGFQYIAMILSNDYNLLTHCVDCLDLPKNNVLDPAYNSKLFRDLSDDLRYKFENNQLSEFWHVWKVDIKAFQSNNLLSKYITPVSYAYDTAGTKYVSSFESPMFPIYATQFHQEMSTFEWINNHANHGYDAVRLEQHFSNFFINESRRNHNQFPDSQDYVIENYKAEVSLEGGYTSLYFFPIKYHAEKEKIYQ